MEIKAEEQQQLLSRSRAVSERMDEQVNPVQERGLGVGYGVSENSNHYTLSPNPVAVDVTNPIYLAQVEGKNEQKVIDYLCSTS